MRCGRNLMKSFLEYYRSIGIIPIQLAPEVTHKKRRPKTHCFRSRTTKDSYRARPHTSRTQVLLHFKDLNINYDSETSLEDDSPYSYRNLNKNVMSKFNEYNEDVRNINVGPTINSPPPKTFIVMPEPSLSIIDFNLITRNGIENAKRGK